MSHFDFEFETFVFEPIITSTPKPSPGETPNSSLEFEFEEEISGEISGISGVSAGVSGEISSDLHNLGFIESTNENDIEMVQDEDFHNQLANSIILKSKIFLQMVDSMKISSSDGEENEESEASSSGSNSNGPNPKPNEKDFDFDDLDDGKFMG